MTELQLNSTPSCRLSKLLPFPSITTRHYQFLGSSGGRGLIFFELCFPGTLFHGPRRLLSFFLCRIPHSLSFFSNVVIVKMLRVV